MKNSKKSNSNSSKMVTISAFCKQNYSDKAMCLYYGKNGREWLPKSLCRVVEIENNREATPDEIQSVYIEVPMWIVMKLKGINFYSVLS